MINKLAGFFKSRFANPTKVTKSAQVALFILFIFSSIWLSTKLIGEISYKQKVITQKRLVNTILKSNISAVEKIKQNYAVLKKTGPEPSKVLMAIPVEASFASLGNEYEAMASTTGARLSKVEQIGEAKKLSNEDAQDSLAQVWEYRYKIKAKGNYLSLQNLTKSIETQLRPTKIESVKISGLEPDLTIEYTLIGYYQPATIISPATEPIR